MDWAELNHDLLHQIAKKVRDISDFVRFRAVCKQWCSAVHPSDLPPQLPYFIHCIRRSNSSFDFQFRPLSFDKTYNLTVQISSSPKDCIFLFGSFTGFVLLLYWKTPISGLILNPLTGFQAIIPIKIEDWFIPLYFGPSCSHDPNLAENGIDLVGYLNESVVPKVILWRYTDGIWRKITEICYGHDDYVVSYSSGRVYIFSYETRNIRVVDVNNGNTVSLLPEVSSNQDQHYCIVEACRDLIGVWSFLTKYNLYPPELDYKYELYQLKDSGTNTSWAKVNDIGDRMLFYDNQRKWLCLKASDFEGSKGNCMYTLTSSRTNHFVNCYSVTTKTTKQLHCFCENYYTGTWFLPSLC
ncbi:hypothetical protein LUZ63_009439 [Rhynchospora breviuscula]|uniref:KIB1-4 beta-propeller domain-containing protein n=1 Tax=Rhynchospora breviuscula TaxID=2022672 RepID=A0A9Q0HNK6_9POAL|nr:hypothetical protein LUZ63_009439 [Rhynchospora breviuscula]